MTLLWFSQWYLPSQKGLCVTGQNGHVKNPLPPSPRIQKTLSRFLQHDSLTIVSSAGCGDAFAVRHQETDLREQGFGYWQGLTNAELAERRDEAWHRFWLAPAHERPPAGESGESFEDVVARVTRTVERFSERYRGRDIVAVAHGGTIRAALAHALAVTPERALGFQIANCSLTRLDHFDGPAGSDLPHALGSWRVGQVNSLFRSSDGEPHGKRKRNVLLRRTHHVLGIAELS